MKGVFKDLTGQTIKGVKVIVWVKSNSYNNLKKGMWLCECWCEEKTRFLVSSEILNGPDESIISCSCNSKLPNDMVGREYGNLEVKEFVKPNQDLKLKKGVRRCHCNMCGNDDFLVTTEYLWTQKIKDCGCTEDVSGTKFACLTTVEKLNDKIYICECDCKEKKRLEVSFEDLATERVRHCGCLSVYNADLTGREFYQLTIERRATKEESKGKGGMWYCKCNGNNPYCKKFIVLTASKITSGHNRSCGCMRKVVNGNKTYKFKGSGEIPSGFWNTSRRNAIKRGLSFEIDIEEGVDLFNKQDRKCALSGVDICFKKGKVKGTASLDRKDSSKGYSVENCQWIHKDLQDLKWTKSNEEVEEWSERIYTERLAWKYQG